jgi:hypothetical protein
VAVENVTSALQHISQADLDDPAQNPALYRCAKNRQRSWAFWGDISFFAQQAEWGVHFFFSFF